MKTEPARIFATRTGHPIEKSVDLLNNGDSLARVGRLVFLYGKMKAFVAGMGFISL